MRKHIYLNITDEDVKMAPYPPDPTVGSPTGVAARRQLSIDPKSTFMLVSNNLNRAYQIWFDTGVMKTGRYRVYLRCNDSLSQ